MFKIIISHLVETYITTLNQKSFALIQFENLPYLIDDDKNYLYIF